MPFLFGDVYCSTGLWVYWICLEIIEPSRKRSSSRKSNLHLSTCGLWRKHAFSEQSDQQPLRKTKQPRTFHQCCIFHTKSICKRLLLLIIPLSVQSDGCCKGCSLATASTYAVGTMKRKHRAWGYTCPGCAHCGPRPGRQLCRLPSFGSAVECTELLRAFEHSQFSNSRESVSSC